MALNNFDDDQFNSEMDDFGVGGEPEPEPEKKPSSRNFLLAIGIIGVILILALVLLLLVAPNIIKQNQANQLQQDAAIYAANTATAAAATLMAQASLPTATPKPTTVIVPTKTPVIVLQTSTPSTESQLSAGELATVQALQTQMAASGGGSSTTPQATSTALPTSGFADEVGLPGMIGLGAVLIAVIFLSRKLRTAIH